MNLTSRISGLQQKHQSLSDAVDAEQRAPAADPLHVAELKKQKLALKEEIQRLQSA